MRFMTVLFSLALMGCVNSGTSASAGAIGGGEPGTQLAQGGEMFGQLAWSTGNSGDSSWVLGMICPSIKKDASR